MGPHHIRDGRVCFRQAKNEHRNPIKIDIPLHSALAASVAAARVSNTYCSAHGVRKATAAALVEAGATPHEIMVVTGHQTLEEVERYIALNACVICIPKIKARPLSE